MDSRNLPVQKKSAIVDRWIEKALESYPSDTSSFLKNKKNQFSNPVGFTIAEGLERVFHSLFEELDVEKITPVLDSIVRIRAVQGLAPSQALSFLFHLKEILGEELEEKEAETVDLASIESRIDVLALLSFDLYMQCREKIYELRARETQNITYRLLQRANLIREIQDPGTDLLEIKIDNIKPKRGTK